MKNDELTFEESKEIAKKLKDAGVVAVNFGGGECALRKDFIPLCEYIKNLGIKISLTTNGTTFPLIKNHLELFHDIGVSLDFPDAKRHDWFRGVDGTFKKAVETSKELVKRGVETEIVTCVTKLNSDIPTLRKMYDLCKEIGVNSWRINRYRPTGRKEIIDKLKLDPETLKKVYTFLASLNNEDTVSISDPIFRAFTGKKGAFAGCPCGTFSFRIHPNGEVTPCIYLNESGGNIKEKTISEIMNSEIFRKIRDRKPMGKCINCKVYEQCKGGCAGSSYLEYGHFNGPDPLCFLESGVKSAELSIPEKWNVHELYLCTVYVPIER
jgi:radical SAM protein with 4Fe4S-binding SPASM domain